MFDVNNIFKISFYYSNARVCRFIEIIQTTDNEKRKVAFKQLVFRMMKDIVNKNISNYLNLITNTKLVSVKAIRECTKIDISDCEFESEEFGWKSHFLN